MRSNKQASQGKARHGIARQAGKHSKHTASNLKLYKAIYNIQYIYVVISKAADRHRCIIIYNKVYKEVYKHIQREQQLVIVIVVVV